MQVRFLYRSSYHMFTLFRQHVYLSFYLSIRYSLIIFLIFSLNIDLIILQALYFNTMHRPVPGSVGHLGCLFWAKSLDVFALQWQYSRYLMAQVCRFGDRIICVQRLDCCKQQMKMKIERGERSTWYHLRVLEHHTQVMGASCINKQLGFPSFFLTAEISINYIQASTYAALGPSFSKLIEHAIKVHPKWPTYQPKSRNKIQKIGHMYNQAQLKLLGTIQKNQNTPEYLT